MNFVDKKIFITGASRGIGSALASSFKKRGGWVIGTARKAKNEFDHKNCDEWIGADFRNIDDILLCREFIQKENIDILINNAGINIINPFLEINPSDFQMIQQINAYAPFMLCQAALPNMVAKSWGRIINICSIWGKISTTGRASYSASKFAMDGITIALASEFGSQGILANCVSPGFVGTDLTYSSLSVDEIEKLVSKVPLRRLGTVDEIAEFVTWLASSENSFITGQNIAIDGGFIRGQ